MTRRAVTRPENDPLWFKDAIIYEVHVRAFMDSDGDGRGDFRGLTQRLDYLQELGVTALWLLPFYPSPLRDDGYDIANYTDVHEYYGNLDDFREFMREAHKRNLRVITELVINHTSDRHPWFQRARRAKPGSRERDFYVWSDTFEKYQDARIIFKDFETSNWTWDSTAGAYYWHRFYSHQPDLNFANPAVRAEVLRVLDFWMKMGVDGMRLDAIPYLFEREGTNCENLPETHDYLKELRAHVDRSFQGRMLLGEANQWPEDAVAYFGEGDECHMSFHFPLMPRLFMALHMENRHPIIDILRQTPQTPSNCQWALFLRNHDELTLEMVTDEERDYMYRTYAAEERARINLGIRRRLAPLLGNNRRRIELLTALLFSLPGTPVLYYGDEIGMGDNIYLGDRDSVRTPMQWSSDRNGGFSRANPQKLYLPVNIDPEYHYEAVNVEAQLNNPNSLLWWNRRLIALRKRYRAFGRGTIEFLEPENYRVLAFLRRDGDESLLCLANLSRFAQHVEILLPGYVGCTPVELFSFSGFPPVTTSSYTFTLGPHDFLWFHLRAPERERIEVAVAESDAPVVVVAGDWDRMLAGEPAAALSAALLRHLALHPRGHGDDGIRTLHPADIVLLKTSEPLYLLVLARCEYRDKPPAMQVFPLGYHPGSSPPGRNGYHLVARVRRTHREESGVLYDASPDQGFAGALAALIYGSRPARGVVGNLNPMRSARWKEATKPITESHPFIASHSDQGNCLWNLAGRHFMKLFVRPMAGSNPDVEVGHFLSGHARFPQVPLVDAWLEYTAPGAERGHTIAVSMAFSRHQGTAADILGDQIGRFVEQALAEYPAVAASDLPAITVDTVLNRTVGDMGLVLMNTVVEPLRLLGRRMAELHGALASRPEHDEFAPEPFSILYQRSLYQALRNTGSAAATALRHALRGAGAAARPHAESLDAQREKIDAMLRLVVGAKLSGSRIRIHGDLHAGQVLYTGKDYVFVDFEGDTRQPLGERRIKRSPLRDVASMLWSFQRLAFEHLDAHESHADMGSLRPDLLEQWVCAWAAWCSALMLDGYLSVEETRPLLPATEGEQRIMLTALVIQRALLNIEYDCLFRPRHVAVPARALLRFVTGRQTGGEETG